MVEVLKQAKPIEYDKITCPGRADLVRGLATHGRDRTVTSAMRRDFHSATPNDTPEAALKELATDSGGSLPVLRDGKLVGLLTAENVMEFLMLKGALKSVAAT